MNAYPLKFTPVFQRRIWGGTRLKTLFGYPIPAEDTGEAWVISDHPNGKSRIANGPYRGKTIGELMDQHSDWFSEERMEKFPLLVKLLDACDDLSVQVHPDDAYAFLHENGELGKSECWYVVYAEPGAEIVYGHTAQTREQLEEMISAGEWNKLLVKMPVKSGDFLYIPHGTIHALGKGIVVLEVQQNSDATYRAYDYDRVDHKGNRRELHIDKVLEVTQVPFVRPKIQAQQQKERCLTITKYLSGPYFTMAQWKLNGSYEAKTPNRFTLLSVLSGEACLYWKEGDMQIRKGDHLLIPRGLGKYTLKGELEAIVSSSPDKAVQLSKAS